MLPQTRNSKPETRNPKLETRNPKPQIPNPTFQQCFHPAMKHVGAVRKELGVKTIFNYLGPLMRLSHLHL